MIKNIYLRAKGARVFQILGEFLWKNYILDVQQWEGIISQIYPLKTATIFGGGTHKCQESVFLFSSFYGRVKYRKILSFVSSENHQLKIIEYDVRLKKGMDDVILKIEPSIKVRVLRIPDFFTVTHQMYDHISSSRGAGP